MDDGNAYDGLVEADPDARWAFGTGFHEILAGVDDALPPGVDPTRLAAYCLMLGDDALVMAQRLTQWVTRAPELEEEVALANIALDLLGQARLLLARAALAHPARVPPLPHGSPVPPEDALAFFRDPRQFRNVRLAEIENGDFARSTARLLVFSTWRLALLERLVDSCDPVLSAVAAKGVKEVTYHRDYAARWFLTLAQGTQESRLRMASGLAEVWPYVEELFVAHEVERELAAAGAGVDPSKVRAQFDQVIATVCDAAELHPEPAPTAAGEPSGRDGVHTETFTELLRDMQSVARAHPSGRW